jgi:hypothetical protein
LGSLALGRSGHSLRITSSSHGTSISHAGSPPPDARALAALQLRRLALRIEKLLKRANGDKAKIILDDPSRAHLEDLATRIEAILDADVVGMQP